MSPYQIVTDPTLRESLRAFPLSDLPASPYTQASILDAFGGLAPVAFVVDGLETGQVAGLAVLSGRATFRYPADGTGSYVLRGMALVSEEDGPTIVGWGVLDEPRRLENPGDYVSADLIVTIQQGGA